MRGPFRNPSPPFETSAEAGPDLQGWEGKCAPKSKRVCQRQGEGGRAPIGDDKLVTSEATTTPDGGDSSAEEGTGGRAFEAPASGPRRALAGDEAICVSLASDGEHGGGGGGALRYWSKAPLGCWGVQTPTGVGYPGKGRRPPVARAGSTRRPRTTRAPVGVAARGGERGRRRGRC